LRSPAQISSAPREQRRYVAGAITFKALKLISIFGCADEGAVTQANARRSKLNAPHLWSDIISLSCSEASPLTRRGQLRHAAGDVPMELPTNALDFP
jgi:hypothetical protein